MLAFVCKLTMTCFIAVLTSIACGVAPDEETVQLPDEETIQLVVDENDDLVKQLDDLVKQLEVLQQEVNSLIVENDYLQQRLSSVEQLNKQDFQNPPLTRLGLSQCIEAVLSEIDSKLTGVWGSVYLSYSPSTLSSYVGEYSHYHSINTYELNHTHSISVEFRKPYNC